MDTPLIFSYARYSLLSIVALISYLVSRCFNIIQYRRSFCMAEQLAHLTGSYSPISDLASSWIHLMTWRCFIVQSMHFPRHLFQYDNLSSLQINTDTIANCADPDDTACNKPSYQNLHCLPFCYWIFDWNPFLQLDVSKFRDGKVHVRNSGVKVLNICERDVKDQIIVFIINIIICQYRMLNWK